MAILDEIVGGAPVDADDVDFRWVVIVGIWGVPAVIGFAGGPWLPVNIAA